LPFGWFLPLHALYSFLTGPQVFLDATVFRLSLGRVVCRRCYAVCDILTEKDILLHIASVVIISLGI